MFKNICFIGLPYSGKSSLGKKICLNKNFGFIETDKMIEYSYNKSLKNIIKQKGINNFLYIEKHIAKSIHCENTLISTGGSIVYSNEAIHHFKKNLKCKIIHLNLSFEEFKKRVSNLEERGVVNPYNLNLEDLYYERIKLSNSLADININADDKDKAYYKLLNIINI